MHKKSLEASKKMSEEEDDDSMDGHPHNGSGGGAGGAPGSGGAAGHRGRDEFRTESIASLRAKAQEHSARVLQELNVKDGPGAGGGPGGNPQGGSLTTPFSSTSGSESGYEDSHHLDSVHAMYARAQAHMPRQESRTSDSGHASSVEGQRIGH